MVCSPIAESPTGGYKPIGREPGAVQVDCVFFGPLREAVGQKTVRREAPPTVGELLAELEAEYPDLAGTLVDDAGPAGDIAITVNQTHLQHLDGLATDLADGDVVRLTPAIHGG